MEISVSRRRFSRKYAGLHAECEAGWQGSEQAARFFRKALKAQHTQSPRAIAVDKNAAYPVAIETLKTDETSQQRPNYGTANT